MSLFQIGLSAINAANLSLNVTANNLKNANKPHYHRQDVLYSSVMGGDRIGGGTQVAHISRGYDALLEDNRRRAESEEQYTQQLKDGYNSINLLFVENGYLPEAISGLSTAIDAVPINSQLGRPSVVQAADTFAERYQIFGNTIKGQINQANDNIKKQVRLVNESLKQLAELNKKISLAEKPGALQQAFDLRDLRDKTVAEINAIIPVRLSENAQGQYSLSTPRGTQLVSGTQASSLEAVSSPSGLYDIQLNGAGNTAFSITDELASGGNGRSGLSALLKLRDVELPKIRNRMGRMAVSVAAFYNLQQQQGVDASGKPGKPLFSVAPPVVKNLNGSSAKLTAKIESPASMTMDDYRITRSAAGYTVTRLPGNTDHIIPPSTPANTFTFEGIKFEVMGTMNVGESFLVQPTADAASSMQVVADPTQLALSHPFSVEQENLPAGMTLSKVNFPSPWDQVTVSFDVTNVNQYSVKNAQGLTIATGAYNASTGSTLAVNGWQMELPPGIAAGQEFTVENMLVKSQSVIPPLSAPPIAAIQNEQYKAASIKFITADEYQVLDSNSNPLTFNGLNQFKLDNNTVSFGGWNFKIESGAPVINQVISLEPSRNSNNIDNGKLMSNMAQVEIFGGVKSLVGELQSTVFEVGITAKDQQGRYEAAGAQAKSALNEQQAVSGVNHDEETIALTTHLNAYRAAGEVISAAQKTMDVLFAML